jgi:hypothetical protein
MKKTVLSILCVFGIAPFLSAQDGTQEAKAAMSGDPVVAQAQDGSFVYTVMPSTAKHGWYIYKAMATALDRPAEILWDGKNPFAPHLPDDLVQKLGTPVARTLTTQWVMSVLSTGKDDVVKQFNQSWQDNGEAEYTGMTAEIFRSQGVDPESKPKKDW